MSGSAVERFVALIREQTGNVVPAARHAFAAELLERRAAAAGCSGPHAYLDRLASGAAAGEWDRLVPLVTIKESTFFRAPQQFAALAQRVLPELVRARAGERRLAVWCAACARGEEAGTVAMVLAASPLLAGWSWRIVGTDLDPEALEAAGRGLYGERAVATVPEPLRERWLERRGNLFELAPELRQRITYRLLNLARPPWERAAEGPFDLVLLRNVLIYFRRPVQRRAVGAVAEELAPRGWLFLGASETLWQVQDRLVPVDLGACFAYRHREAGEPTPAPPSAARAAGSGGAPTPARPRAATPAAAAAPASPAAGGRGEDPLGVQERLAAAARRAAEDDLAGAGRELAAVLAADPSEAAAHALDGFLRDVGGDGEAAIASYRAALYLDPRLFQVRLLLADRLARGGWRERAAHEYREVLATLGSGRELGALDALPLPDRAGAERRCRDALRRADAGGGGP